MRILILDDAELRHAEYARRFRKHEVVHVRTVRQAKEALMRIRFELVQLDHDLGDLVSEVHLDGTPREATGLDVADFITRMPPPWRPGRVVIHSWNADDAQDMLNVLRRAGVEAVYAPFRVEDP